MREKKTTSKVLSKYHCAKFAKELFYSVNQNLQFMLPATAPGRSRWPARLLPGPKLTGDGLDEAPTLARAGSVSPTPSPPGTAAGPASGQAGPTIRVWDAPPEPEAQGGVEGREHGAP